MGKQEKYVCDADCLINLHRHFGRNCIRVLRRLAKEGSLYIPEGIARELLRGTDVIARFVQRYRDNRDCGEVIVWLKDNPRLREEVAQMEQSYGESICVGGRVYPGFWSSQSGRKAADGQIVAVAKVLGGTVVSDDAAVKLACALENVPCIGWSEFARRLGLLRLKQLMLQGL